MERVSYPDHLSKSRDGTDFDVFYEWREFGLNSLECDYHSDGAHHYDLRVRFVGIVRYCSLGRASMGRDAFDEGGIWVVWVRCRVCDFCAGKECIGEVCIGGRVCWACGMGILGDDEEREGRKKICKLKNLTLKIRISFLQG